jgi:hypothetical protein
MDAGSMTVALQVTDPVTGTLLEVAVQSAAREPILVAALVTSASNRTAANTILKGWSEQLKRDLDAARGK